MPGPIIGELGQLGIKTGVEGGKVAIKADKVLVKEGEEINAKQASLLLRLGETPMEIGLDITAIYENGIMYDKKVLDIDETKFAADLMTAISQARGLAIELHIQAKTQSQILSKSTRQSKALALKPMY
jgi:large subunit ribosomal protein L10